MMQKRIENENLAKTGLASVKYGLTPDSESACDMVVTEKVCSVCKEVKDLLAFNERPERPSGYRTECKRCQYDRQYRREKRSPEKIKAKEIANLALKRGELQAPFLCEMCSQVKPLDKHHPDYTKPKEVIFVCRKCHATLLRPKEIMKEAV